jgi:hypothetical protein
VTGGKGLVLGLVALEVFWSPKALVEIKNKTTQQKKRQKTNKTVATIAG